MKNVKILLLLFTVLIVTACSKDDTPDSIDPDPENRAPTSFSLLEVENNSANIDILPMLSWEQAIDPDGDLVKYDFYLYKEGSDVLPENKLASNLNVTSFRLKNKISLLTNYKWYVVAKDGKGKETNSDVFSFTTRNLNIPNDPITEAAAFSKRYFHSVTFFKNKLWLIGGVGDDGFKSDIFYSENGIDWANENDEIQNPTSGHSTVVFNDTLWVLGGREKNVAIGGLTNLMLASLNGRNFNDDFIAPWSSRYLHASVVFKNKLWVLGGFDDNLASLNDVWSTTNVRTWDTNSQEIASWPSRLGHTAVVFDDKLWVIGGFGKTYLNDVWYTDGSTSSNGNLKWEPVAQQKEFPARYLHQTVIYDNKIWIIGGIGESDLNKNDIWFSEDGANWISLTLEANFSERIGHTLTVFNEKMFLIAGVDNNDFLSDIWMFD